MVCDPLSSYGDAELDKGMASAIMPLSIIAAGKSTITWFIFVRQPCTEKQSLGNGGQGTPWIWVILEFGSLQ